MAKPRIKNMKLLGDDQSVPVTKDEHTCIRLFEPQYRIEECLAEIRQCLESGWTGFGPLITSFEKQWARYSELPNSHFVSSGTAALHLALRVLKEKNAWVDGDEIITTPFTFVSTNHVILYERLNPVFADIDEYLCLNPEEVVRKITARTRAVMFVGIGGNAGQLPAIAQICAERGLKLILDAAHMAGTRLEGRHVGQQADVATFSFHSVKNLPTADAGMVCFKESRLDKAARRWSWMGIDKDTFARWNENSSAQWNYGVVHEGFKYHGNSIMASLASVGLRYLDQDNSYRRQIAAWYDALLANHENIRLIPLAPDCESSRHLYQVRVPERDRVVGDLNQLGIFPGVHYAENTRYSMYAQAKGTCPQAESASNDVISLPIHMHLTRDDVGVVAERLIRAVNFNCSAGV